MAFSEPTRKKYARIMDWHPQKPTIKKLYIDDHHTLDRVMSIMACEYNFHATKNMYKKRIKSWGLNKNLNENEIHMIVQHKKELDAAGKSSLVCVKGRVVDAKRLQRYMERKERIHSRASTEPSGTSRPPGIAAQKISSSVPVPLRQSPVLLVPERIAIAARDYIRGHLDNPNFRTSPAEDYACHTQIYHCTKAFSAVLKSLSSGKLASQTILDRAFSLLKGPISSNSPRSLMFLLRLSAWILIYGRPELQQILHSYIAQLSAIIGGINHPIATISSQLMQCNSDNIAEVLPRVMKEIQIELLKGLQSGHWLAENTLLEEFQVMCNAYGELEAMKRLEEWIGGVRRNWDLESVSWHLSLQVTRAETQELHFHLRPNETQEMFRTPEGMASTENQSVENPTPVEFIHSRKNEFHGPISDIAHADCKLCRNLEKPRLWTRTKKHLLSHLRRLLVESGQVERLSQLQRELSNAHQDPWDRATVKEVP